MLNRTQITNELCEYLLRVSVQEPDVLRRLREQTESMPDAEMLVPPEEGRFLYFLTALTRAQKALEVGVFTGYSALWTALALPSNGQLIACDVSAEWTAIGRQYWKEARVSDRIHLRLGDARETLQQLIDECHSGTFDLAFIDADKANYLTYYELVLRLVRPGGLIVIDNVLRSGEVCDAENTEAGTVSVRALNEKLSRDERIFHCMVPVADGMTLAVRCQGV